MEFGWERKQWLSLGRRNQSAWNIVLSKKAERTKNAPIIFTGLLGLVVGCPTEVGSGVLSDFFIASFIVLAVSLLVAMIMTVNTGERDVTTLYQAQSIPDRYKYTA
jgi:hypothetical protein